MLSRSEIDDERRRESQEFSDEILWLYAHSQCDYGHYQKNQPKNQPKDGLAIHRITSFPMYENQEDKRRIARLSLLDLIYLASPFFKRVSLTVGMIAVTRK